VHEYRIHKINLTTFRYVVVSSAESVQLRVDREASARRLWVGGAIMTPAAIILGTIAANILGMSGSFFTIPKLAVGTVLAMLLNGLVIGAGYAFLPSGDDRVTVELNFVNRSLRFRESHDERMTIAKCDSLQSIDAIAGKMAREHGTGFWQSGMMLKCTDGDHKLLFRISPLASHAKQTADDFVAQCITRIKS
jgi:hypothetical protein